MLTDQTSAHDPLTGYVPVEMTPHAADVTRMALPRQYVKLSLASMERHVRAMVELQRAR